MKRKRSGRIALAVVATVGAAAALTTWLDDDSSSEMGTAGETMFRDAAECRQSYDDATCDEKFAEAKAEHDRLSPKYATRDDCEREIGAGLCTITDAPPARAEDGEPDRTAAMPPGGWFMPAFAGFLIGRSLLAPAVPLHYGPPPPGAAVPDCPRSPDGSCRPMPAAGGSGSASHVWYCGGGSASSGSGYRSAAYYGTVSRSGTGRAIVTSPGTRAASGVASTSSSVSRGGFGAAGRAASGGSSAS
ncbi:MAG TPA: DUF1190 domain-containing protein [Stellaceae bacterium]